MIIELSWSTVLHALLSSETILCHLDEGPPTYMRISQRQMKSQS